MLYCYIYKTRVTCVILNHESSFGINADFMFLEFHVLHFEFSSLAFEEKRRLTFTVTTYLNEDSVKYS